MAALTLPPPPAMVRPLDTKSWSSAEPQGPEDKQLREKARAALAHWTLRAEIVLAEETDGTDYNSVPLKTKLTVHVIYRHVGPLKPLPYSLDE